MRVGELNEGCAQERFQTDPHPAYSRSFFAYSLSILSAIRR